MTRYFIESVQCGIGKGGMACGPVSGPIVAEACVKTDDGKAFFMALSEVDGLPQFFKSKKSTYEQQINMDASEEEWLAVSKYMLNTSDGEYEEILANRKAKYYDLFRYLIYIVRADWDECNKFQQETTRKYLDEIVIPASDIELDYIYENEDAELYAKRLALETDVKTDSVFHHLDAGAFREIKKELKALKESCEEESEYKAWKEAYLEEEYRKVANQKFLVCGYLFAGIGQYEMVIPEEQLECFENWINANGSAFMCGNREANKEEVKVFLGLNATFEA